MYFCIPFLIRLSAPIITGIVAAFIPHNLSISISRFLYFESFSVIFIEVLRSVGTDISSSWQFLPFLSFITM